MLNFKYCDQPQLFVDSSWCRSGEMANTLRSGRSERKLLWVQVPPSAITYKVLALLLGLVAVQVVPLTF